MNVLVRAFHAGAPSATHAVRGLIDTVKLIIGRLSPEYVIFAGEGGYASRAKLLPSYKQHRPPKPQELIDQIALAESALEAIGWPLIRAEGWEADDVLASLCSQLADKSAGVFVCSSDKDLLQLLDSPRPPAIYHPWDGGKQVNRQSVFEKYNVRHDQFGDYLAMDGDKTDGVPGVDGIGPKTAAELLGKYGDLASILEAARLQKIPGAAGKKLRDQVDKARLSRRLVELQKKIPIPADWQDWPVQSPRSNWLSKLQALGLGAVGQRLAEQIPVVGESRSYSSEIVVKGFVDDAIDDEADIQKDRAADVSSDLQSQETNESAKRPEDPNPVAADGTACLSDPNLETGNDDKPELAVLHRADSATSLAEELSGNLARAIGTDFSNPCWVEGFPVLRDFPKEAPAEILLLSIYANAWRQRVSRVENGWRPGTDSHFVEQLAIDGKPFSLPVAARAIQEAHATTVVAPKFIASPPQSKRPVARSLFD